MKYKKIFKTNPSKNVFITTLKECSMINNKKYIFYDELYKKNSQLIKNYVLTLKDNYHISKHNYLENIDFKKCITVIKQISSLYDITIETNRVYQNNSYKIYYIFSI